MLLSFKKKKVQLIFVQTVLVSAFQVPFEEDQHLRKIVNVLPNNFYSWVSVFMVLDR